MDNRREHKDFIKWGNGKKVLILLHYFGGDASCWKWVTEKLSPEFTCIAFNLPGCGSTDLSEIPSLNYYANFIQLRIKEMDIKNYTLIGHSMGGKIAMLIAATDLDNSVQQLVLIAPSPPGIENISADDKSQLLRSPSAADANNLVQKLIKKPINNLQSETAIAAQMSMSVKVREWWVITGSQQSILHMVYKIHCPVKVLCSMDDPAISYATIKKEVVGIFEEIVLITTKSTGHLYPLEAPEWVAKNIETDFITSINLRS